MMPTAAAAYRGLSEVSPSAGGDPARASHDAAFLGLLRLQTRFPRLPGDAGLAESFPMPVRVEVVAGATPRAAVLEAGAGLLDPFVAAARRLVAMGAAAITTSCGFLVRFQAELQAAVDVPVWTSALLKLPELERPGVLTVDAAALGPQLLRAAGARADTPVEGLDPGGSLRRTLLEDRPTLDAAAAESQAVAAARRLVARHPRVDSIVLECTNLPPYAAAIGRATGRPVHHLVTCVAERWGRR
jgi:hypothetical protein